MHCELWCVCLCMCESIEHGHDHGHGTSSSWAHIIKFAQWSTHTHIYTTNFVCQSKAKKKSAKRIKKTKIHKSVERITTGVLNEAWRLLQSIVACHFVKFSNRTLRLQRDVFVVAVFQTELSISVYFPFKEQKQAATFSTPMKFNLELQKIL